MLHFDMMKDTNLFRVGNWSGGGSRHVAVEGNLQSVAIGSIIKKTTEEAPTSTSLHLVTVKWSVGLEKNKKWEWNEDDLNITLFKI